MVRGCWVIVHVTLCSIVNCGGGVWVGGCYWIRVGSSVHHSQASVVTT